MSAAWAHGAGGRDGGDRGNGANGPGQADDAAAKRKKRKKKPAPYKLDAKLRKFWSAQMDEMNGLTGQTPNDFKNHNDLPKARIKRIMQVMMQADEQCSSVRMIRAEAPLLFAKACEMFILELSLHAYGFSVQRQRKNLNKDDVRKAVDETNNLDFLAKILRLQDGGVDDAGEGASAGGAAGGSSTARPAMPARQAGANGAGASSSITADPSQSAYYSRQRQFLQQQQFVQQQQLAGQRPLNPESQENAGLHLSGGGSGPQSMGHRFAQHARFVPQQPSLHAYQQYQQHQYQMQQQQQQQQQHQQQQHHQQQQAQQNQPKQEPKPAS